MANRYYKFAEGEYYHLYNRGNSKQTIFKNESDFERFKKLLFIANTDKHFVFRDYEDENIFDIEREIQLVYVGAYCLMSNHFHLLLTPAVENGVQKFMLKLATGYSSYFNKKYERTGGLFEGSYKAKFVDSDKYLKYLFSYIHLNPYRKVDHEKLNYINHDVLRQYKHSSLRDYLGEIRDEGKILNKEKFPMYFETIQDNERELMEWLDFQEF